MTETTGTSSPKTRKTAKPAVRKTPAAGKTSNVVAIAPATRKTQEKNPATAAKTKARNTATATSLGTEERQRLIAEAAYLRAEQRNFIGGDPVTDWLEAEADVDASLSDCTC